MYYTIGNSRIFIEIASTEERNRLAASNSYPYRLRTYNKMSVVDLLQSNLNYRDILQCGTMWNSEIRKRTRSRKIFSRKKK